MEQVPASDALLLPGVALRRPHRADARRNYDALLAAAREAFSEIGTGVSLEDIARRAGVGIGTLYRNFPNRQELFDAVYVGEVEELCLAAGAVEGVSPVDALTTWLRRFAEYVATKRAMAEALNRDSAMFRACREAMYAAGEPLLARAQAGNGVRSDVDIDTLLRLVSGVSAVEFISPEQRQHALDISLDGLRVKE